eukprot:TRINITY_DN2511_c0_g1_i2.p1 TRINITY_DN2511_c0_g1~~TRINITY_DN2511_c0_g1_i2.p1  ORF type:complete len:1500 (-),score=371.52 TRINITY_DN2511_c0_g1_i2:1731-6230(-)
MKKRRGGSGTQQEQPSAKQQCTQTKLLFCRPTQQAGSDDESVSVPAAQRAAAPCDTPVAAVPTKRDATSVVRHGEGPPDKRTCPESPDLGALCDSSAPAPAAPALVSSRAGKISFLADGAKSALEYPWEELLEEPSDAAVLQRVRANFGFTCTAEELRLYDEAHTETDLQRLRAQPVSLVYVVPPGGAIPQSICVDITPSTNLLTKGGATDYNVAGAIAEMVDNSLQALQSLHRSHTAEAVADKGEVQVVINLGKKKDAVCEPKAMLVAVWDNGPGMNFSEFSSMLKLGESNNAEKAHFVEERAGVTDAVAATVAHISRYGVGAKKAGFFLGKRILIQSKCANSTHALQATLSLTEIEERKSWECNVRTDVAPQHGVPHYTVIKIDELSIVIHEDDVKHIKRTLALVYYFFMHTEKLPVEIGAELTKCDIMVNRENLSLVQDDLLSLMYERGRNAHGAGPKIFKVYVQSANCSVHVYLWYFPFVNSEETMPVAADLEHQRESDNTAKPGVIVFYAGRAVLHGHIDRLCFMKAGKHQGTQIQEKWINRVKGVVFVPSTFPVTNNKMHILPEFVQFKELIQSAPSRVIAKDGRQPAATSLRNLTKEFKKWVYDCHTKFDQEVKATGEKYDKASNTTTFESFTRDGGDVFEKGKYVELKRSTKDKTPIVGNIEQIFCMGRGLPKGDADLHMQCKLLLITWADDNEEQQTVAISRLKHIISKEAADKHRKEQMRRLPAKMKISCGDDKDSITMLPSELQAKGEGCLFKAIIVRVYNSMERSTPIEAEVANACKVNVSFSLYFGGEKKEGKKHVEVGDGGKVVFRKVGHGTDTRQAGKYKLKFRCSYKQVQTVCHEFEVKPGEPCKVVLQISSDNREFALGTELDNLNMQLLDRFANAVPFASYAAAKIGLTCSNCEDPEATLQLGYCKPEINETFSAASFKVTLVGGALAENHTYNLCPRITDADLECIPLQITVCAGAIAAVKFVDDTKVFGEDAVYETGASLPGFSVQLLDGFGNVVLPRVATSAATGSKRRRRKQRDTEPQASQTQPVSGVRAEVLTVVVSSPLFLEEARADVGLQDGIARFSGKQLCAGPKPGAGAVTIRVLRGGAPAESSAEWTFPVHVATPPPVELTLSCGGITVAKSSTDGSKDAATIQIVAGTTRHYSVSVSRGGGDAFEALDGTVETTWAPKTRTPVDNADTPTPLPELIAETKCVEKDHRLTFTERGSGRRADIYLTVVVTPCPPFKLQFDRDGNAEHQVKVEVPQHWSVRVVDKYLNHVRMLSDVGFDLLSLQPVLKLVSDNESNALSLSRVDIFSAAQAYFPVTFSAVGTGPCAVTAEDPRGEVAAATQEIKIVAGKFKQLHINGVPRLRLQKHAGDFIEELTITLCDMFGSVCDYSGTVVDGEWSCTTDEEPPFAFPRGKQVKEGKLQLSNLLVFGKPGSYVLTLSPRGVSVDNKGLGALELTVEASEESPVEIAICECPNIVEATKSFVVVAEVLSAAG